MFLDTFPPVVFLPECRRMNLDLRPQKPKSRHRVFLVVSWVAWPRSHSLGPFGRWLAPGAAAAGQPPPAEERAGNPTGRPILNALIPVLFARNEEIY